MVESIQRAGVPASISNTAGTYVCNHLMYGVLHHLARFCPEVPGGFMHVPYLHEQVKDKPNTPSLSVSEITAGIRAAMEAIVSNT